MRKNKLIVGLALAVGFLMLIAIILMIFPPNKSALKEGKSSGLGPIVAQDIAFSGAINGRMTSAQRGDGFTCTVTRVGPIIGKIGAKEYVLDFSNFDGTGAGSFEAVVQIAELPEREIQFGSGGVKYVLNADLRSGRIDGELSNLKDPSQKVKIVGSWNCPPDF